ncbi:MAG: MmcQ/YjbR family DNA-binding protein [Ignavibacteria bacterium]
MITIKTFREIALSLPESSEAPHFEKTSFRAGKKIFATLDDRNHLACLKLSPVDQNVFSLVNSSAVFPVPNKWGLQGWTNFDLKKVNKSTMIDALTTAFFNVSQLKQNNK